MADLEGASGRALYDWDTELAPLLDGTFAAFLLDDAPKEEDSGTKAAKSDIDNIYFAESKVKEATKRAKDVADRARDDLRSIARNYEQQRIASTRSSTLPSASEHEARMNEAKAERLAILRQNVDMEQTLRSCKEDLIRLQREMDEEEGEAVQAAELNSEVLRIKVYRDLGFTPVEENGIFSKVLVRSSASQHAATIQLDSKSSDFFWSNLLWDQLQA